MGFSSFFAFVNRSLIVHYPSRRILTWCFLISTRIKEESWTVGLHTNCSASSTGMIFCRSSISAKSRQTTLFCLRNCWRSNPHITQHFRCQTGNFQGCDLSLQKSKRQSDLWEFFASFPISCLMLLILTHSTPLKREFPHICKSESKFLNFAVAFTSYKLAFTFASDQKQANFSIKFTCRRYSPQFLGQRQICSSHIFWYLSKVKFPLPDFQCTDH